MVKLEELRAQAVLIGGTILLIILVAVILPLILQLNQAAVSVEQGVRLAAQVKMRATKEKVYINFFYNGTHAAILINNTGTIRVVIERVIIINRTNGGPVAGKDVCSVESACGIINIANASQNPLVKDAQPLYDHCLVGILRGGHPENLYCLDDKNQVAVLDPGDVLYISIKEFVVRLLNNSLVYAESAYGVIHPVVAPPAVGKAGVQISPKLLQAIPRGPYVAFSGFVIWGYKDLTNWTYTEIIRPPLRVSTLGPLDPSKDCGGIPFKSTFIYNDYKYPGLFKVLIVPEDNSYIYYYCNGQWYKLRLISNHHYYIEGFVGTYSTDKPSEDSTCGHDNLVLVDGWAYEIIDADTNTVLASATSCYGLGSVNPIIEAYDFDKNNVSELVFATTYTPINETDVDADGTFNQRRNIYEYYAFFEDSEEASEIDDALVVAHYVLRDITGVDAIQVSLKVNFYWVNTVYGDIGAGIDRLRPMPVAAVGLLKLVEEGGNYVWKLVAYRAVEFKVVKPFSFWINVIFPVNRTDIYRLVVYTYDPYGWVGEDNTGIVSWGQLCDRFLWWYTCIPPGGLDTIVTVEHIIVQYFVHNPILRRIPVIYIVNMTGVPYWPSGVETSFGVFGYINETHLSMYWNALLSYIAMYGVHPIIIRDWGAFKALLGSPQAPIGAIVIFLHGPILPYKPDLKLYDALKDDWIRVHTPFDLVKWLADMIHARKWIVVFPYGPSLAFVWNTETNSWEGKEGEKVDGYITGSLLSEIIKRLLNLTETPEVEYIFVLTGGFDPVENYTVGMTLHGRRAVVAARAWAAPSIFIGNYSIVRKSAILYYDNYTVCFWANSTPPPGYTWSLGVHVSREEEERGPACGVIAVNATAVTRGGVAIFVAAPRPGVISPRGLAAVDIAVAIYAWKSIFEFK